MAPKIAELRTMTDDQLIRGHDAAAESTVVGLGYYLDELSRRRADRQMAAVVRLTWIIALLTLANVVLVALDVL